jgi:glutamyl-tRNA reductase
MYNICVFGINHSTADADLRDEMSFTKDDIPDVLRRLNSSRVTQEVLILSTCNRMEVYCVTNDLEFVINSICALKNICPRTIRRYTYSYFDTDCAKHLFKVSSGIDSLVVGETEIVGQIKGAIALARQADSIGSSLLGLFQMALSVEKDVRNVSGVSNISVSLGSMVSQCVDSYVAKTINQRQTENQLSNTSKDFESRSITFIGAGEMMSRVVPYFKANTAKKVIVNRTVSKAQDLAMLIDAQALSLDSLADIVNNSFVVISCIDGKAPVITPELLQPLLNQGKPVLLIDLSMPMMVSKKFHAISGVELITIDDVVHNCNKNSELRRDKLESASNQLIEDKLKEYNSWIRKKHLSPLIKALRDDAESIRLEVLSNAGKQLTNGESPEDVMAQMSLKLINKLLHKPVTNLAAADSNSQPDLATLVRNLYDISI